MLLAGGPGGKGSARAYLSLDQGGQSTRALLFDASGAFGGSAAVPIAVETSAGDRVEHDAAEVARSVAEAVARVLREARVAPKEVAAAGLATQRSSIVCWDRARRVPLTPVLSWQDRRAATWLAPFAPHAGRIRAITGLFLSPHYGASKIRWCLDHVPDVARARDAGTLACGPLASFLAHLATAPVPAPPHAPLTDPANASRTLLFDAERRDWSDELLALFGIPRVVLPHPVPNRHEFGLLAAPGGSIPLAIVTGDQSAAIFCQGAPDPSAVYVNLGTGAFLQRIAAPIPGLHDRLLAGIVYDDGASVTRVLEATVNGCGSALAAFGREYRVPDLDERLSQWLVSERDPPLHLNGISGLGSPWWIPDFESRFAGAGSVAARAVAVVEGILFLIARNLEEMSRGLEPPARLIASGGLARNAAIIQRLADLVGLPVECPVFVEATARGLAWLCSDRRPWLDPAPPHRFDPRVDPALAERYRRWRDLMPRPGGDST